MKKIILGILVLSSVTLSAAEPFKTFDCKITAGPNHGQSFIIFQTADPKFSGANLVSGNMISVPVFNQNTLFKMSFMGNTYSPGYMFKFSSNDYPDSTVLMLTKQSPGKLSGKKKFKAQFILTGYDFVFETTCKKL